MSALVDHLAAALPLAREQDAAVVALEARVAELVNEADTLEGQVADLETEVARLQAIIDGQQPQPPAPAFWVEHMGDNIVRCRWDGLYPTRLHRTGKDLTGWPPDPRDGWSTDDDDFGGMPPHAPFFQFLQIPPDFDGTFTCTFDGGELTAHLGTLQVDLGRG